MWVHRYEHAYAALTGTIAAPSSACAGGAASRRDGDDTWSGRRRRRRRLDDYAAAHVAFRAAVDDAQQHHRTSGCWVPTRAVLVGVVLIAGIAVLVALGGLAGGRGRLRDDDDDDDGDDDDDDHPTVAAAATSSSEQQLEIQRAVLSQIAHEMRHSHAWALHVLEHVGAAVADAPPDDPGAALALRASLVARRPDLDHAAALLHEADAVVATRLTLHQIYAGTYATRAHVQTVELATLLQQRVEVARPFAQRGVDVAIELPPRYAACDVFVRLDTYIFRCAWPCRSGDTTMWCQARRE